MLLWAVCQCGSHASSSDSRDIGRGQHIGSTAEPTTRTGNTEGIILHLHLQIRLLLLLCLNGGD